MLNDVLVLGAGSAGLLAALSIKRRMPQVKVRVVRSPDIGVVGVGESTTPNVAAFLFDFLRIPPRQFYALAEPTWKLGVNFLWGPRPSFIYPFALQLDLRHPQLPRPHGYYCHDDFSALNVASALMAEGKAFLRQSGGAPDLAAGYAFHLENVKLIEALLQVSRESGIEFIDGTLRGAEKGPEGISSLLLEDGRVLKADFYIDASGFRSELLGKAMEEPFLSFDQSLFNDRAVLGSWDRTTESILPYTTAETMDAGWSWQIDHEHKINRGYVYSSGFISEEQAREEFARKNPKARLSDRTVRFKSGRYRNCWAGNVLAVGNSCGFAEPLEATALMMICWQCQSFVEMVQFVGVTATVRDLYNQLCGVAWDEVRDFLTLHFVINTRLNTPYWQACREDADQSSFKSLMDFYRESGPSGFARYNMRNTASQFGIEGYLVQLVGNQVPYKNRHTPRREELELMQQIRLQNKTSARAGMTVKEALEIIRHPAWRWAGEGPAPMPVAPPAAMPAPPRQVMQKA
jgi:tryptophan 7-halogenase